MTQLTEAKLFETLRLKGPNPHSLESDFRRLKHACDGDLRRLKRYITMRCCGDPIEYIVGHLEFRGRRFNLDRRVYITDPEATHLVDAVTARARALACQLGRPPVLLEFGIGAGTLGISVKKECPEIHLIGTDIDPGALAVCQENARAHHADILLCESDMFDSLPSHINPDLVFSDPPWGDETSIYTEDRNGDHYNAMPTLATYPQGGITGMHERLLKAIGEQSWSTEVIVNGGVLPHDAILQLGGLARNFHTANPTQDITLLFCTF